LNRATKKFRTLLRNSCCKRKGLLFINAFSTSKQEPLQQKRGLVFFSVELEQPKK
jgi:hypothetical protein